MRANLVGELDAPEVAAGIQQLEAEFHGPFRLRLAHADHAAFAGFLREAVEDFNARAEGRGERGADVDQSAGTAHGDRFAWEVEGLALRAVAINLHWNANSDAARAPAFEHCARG